MLLIITISFLTYVLFGIVTYNCLVKVFTKKVIERDEDSIISACVASFFWPILLIGSVLYVITIFITKYAERIACSIYEYIKDKDK